jgi:hypothetical protein
MEKFQINQPAAEAAGYPENAQKAGGEPEQIMSGQVCSIYRGGAATSAIVTFFL